MFERAMQFRNEGRYQEALPLARESNALRENLLGTQHLLVAESLTLVGDLLHQESKISESRPLFERALSIREAQLGPDDPLAAESLTNVARALYADGQFSKSKPLLQRAVHIRELQSTVNNPDLGVSLVHLSIVESQWGDLSAARSHMERAIRLLEPTEKSRPLDLAMALNYYGNILRRIGEFGEARPPLERSLQIREQVLGPGHSHVARSLSRLGMLELSLGNPQKALPLFERALAIDEHNLGLLNAEIPGHLNEIGRTKIVLGDASGAQASFKRALQVQEQTVGPQHPFVAITLNELGHIAAKEGRIDEAKALYHRAIKIQEAALGSDSVYLAETLNALGYLEVQRGALREAEQYFSRSVQIRQAALSPNHPDLAASYFNLARAKHALGNLKGARPFYERGRSSLLANSMATQGLDEATQSRVWAGQVKGMYDYELLLADIARQPTLDSNPPSALSDAFLVAEQARGWIVQSAVARAMARETLSDDSTVQLIQKLDELRRTRQALWNLLNDLYGQPTDQRNGDEASRAKDELRAVQEEIDTIIKRIERAEPRYAELALPKPTSLSEAQSMLAQDEALISWFTLNDRLMVWALRGGQTPLYRETVLPQSEFIDLVQRVRRSLTPSTTGSDTSSLPAFDVEAAYELHRYLFGPIGPYLSGIRQLILIPDRILLPLPFATLLSSRGGAAHEMLADLVRGKKAPTPQQMLIYRSLPWLAKSYTLTVVPSASVMMLLRQSHQTPKNHEEAFIGFGDPALSGDGRDRGGSMPRGRGTRVARDQILSLNRLPGTREELFAIASALGAPKEHNIFIDHNATETALAELNQSGRLGRTKVVSFATHGLLAGELAGLSQPALVLTPPDTPSDDNDGLLSLDEILRLRMPSTEWVVLSACNTAGADGSGEGLSGLARAFFFAGAKALLVSQWSVDDAATQVLMTEIFKRYSAYSSLPAKALQDGLLATMDHAGKDSQKRYFAHPYAWAAFFLVGNGSPRN
jgi:CHAT domain-containing protein/Tfp pilus assembly protein PilF